MPASLTKMVTNDSTKTSQLTTFPISLRKSNPFYPIFMVTLQWFVGLWALVQLSFVGVVGVVFCPSHFCIGHEKTN
ncbi:hypothetical protein Q31b_54820 [Novipirellula aureliae]|uniref:Uncharacterized protein n=1 Tax=Novipirellula aureliae TaxID=2527966 RepID=A0A5C6DCV6_9BACT|nr:hypothetical protein Q31b_54820 [Novipirellula aureliae]